MQSDNIVYKFYYQWWKNIDKSIFLLISLLFIIGLFFSLVSTSLIASDKLDTNNYFFFFKHLIYVLIGISLIFIFSSLNSDQLYKYSIFKNSFTYTFSKKAYTCNWLYCFIRLKIMSTCFSIKKWKNTSLDIIKPGNIFNKISKKRQSDNKCCYKSIYINSWRKD